MANDQLHGMRHKLKRSAISLIVLKYNKNIPALPYIVATVVHLPSTLRDVAEHRIMLQEGQLYHSDYLVTGLIQGLRPHDLFFCESVDVPHPSDFAYGSNT